MGRWVRANVSTDPALTSYTLRHTFAGKLRENGIDVETIEYCTGHRDQRMLTQHYAPGVGMDRLKAAINELDFGFIG